MILKQKKLSPIARRLGSISLHIVGIWTLRIFFPKMRRQRFLPDLVIRPRPIMLGNREFRLGILRMLQSSD